MNVFELFATLGLDTSSYDDSLDKSEQKGRNFGQVLGSVVATGAKVGAAALVATGTAVVGAASAFSKGVTAVSNYGDEIDKNSQRLGISAEKYQAFDYALNIAGTSMSNMRMGMKTLTNQIDEAKNGSESATKRFEALGISMEDLQKMSREEIFEAAIYGFQGMADSTERAALANDLFGRSGQELTPLFNMTQEETQKLIGTAHEYGMVMSNEAVKASASFKDSMTTLQGTMSGVKNNLMAEFMPSLTTAINGLAMVFSGTDTEEGLATMSDGISAFASDLVSKAPKIFAIGGTIIKALATSITTNLPTLLSAAVPIVMELVTGVISNLPAVVDAAVTLIGSIVDGINENLPTILTAAQQIIMTIASALANNAPTIIPTIVQLIMTIVTTLTNPETIVPIIEAGISIIQGLIEGIVGAIPVIIEQLPVIIDNIANVLLQGLPIILDAGVQIFMSLIDALPVILEALGTALPTVIDTIVQLVINGMPLLLKGAIQLFMAIINALPTIISALVKQIPTIVTTTISVLLKNLPQLIKGAIELFMGIIKAIPTIIVELGKQMPTIIKTIVDGLTSGISQVTNIGSQLIRGLWNGISNMSKWIGEKIKGFGKGVLDGLKNFFQIRSPSHLIEKEVGEYVGLAVGTGFEKTMPKVIAGMVESVGGVSDKIRDAMTMDDVGVNIRTSTALSAGGEAAGATSGFGGVIGGMTFNFNVYATEGQDVRQLAKNLMTEVQNIIDDREKAYG